MPLEWRDWNRVKNAVNKIKNPVNRWENAAWASVAFSFSLGLQYIIEYGFNLPDSARAMFFLSSSIAFLIIVIICFLVSFRVLKDCSESKDNVLEKINEIEKYIKKGQFNEIDTSQLTIISANYGFEDKQIDVKHVLEKHIQNNSIRLTVNNEVMGKDPYKGEVKNLNIKYQLEGMIYEKDVAEYKELIIP
jgi:hypothetical protein